jgi:hypothetical protein
MITILSSFFNQFKIYIYLGLAIVLAYFYLQNQSLKTDLKESVSSLAEQKQINDLTIKGYEKTLAIEREVSNQKAITQEQKIEVVKTTSKVKEAVIKRGEIKPDEKSNFTIVTF